MQIQTPLAVIPTNPLWERRRLHFICALGKLIGLPVCVLIGSPNSIPPNLVFDFSCLRDQNDVHQALLYDIVRGVFDPHFNQNSHLHNVFDFLIVAEFVSVQEESDVPRVHFFIDFLC